MRFNPTLTLGSLAVLAATGLIQIPAAAAATLSYEETVSGITGSGTGTDYSHLPVSDRFGNDFSQPATGTLGSPADPGFSFYDDFVFTVANSTVDAASFVLNDGTTSVISDLQMRLYSASGNSTLPVLGNAPAGLLAGWSNAFNTQLSGGTYVLEVRGDVTGTAGGSYTGIIDLQPVPIPAALPLILSGLGLLYPAAAGSGRRRR